VRIVALYSASTLARESMMERWTTQRGQPLSLFGNLVQAARCVVAERSVRAGDATPEKTPDTSTPIPCWLTPFGQSLVYTMEDQVVPTPPVGVALLPAFGICYTPEPPPSRSVKFVQADELSSQPRTPLESK